MTGGLRMSVVVPTYRRPARLARCLAALAGHDLPDDALEVVVVDDGTPEPDAAGVRAAVAAVPARLAVRLHRQDNAGPATARNAGAALAGAPVVAFTDDDCTPDPGWARALLAALVAEPDALAAGATRNVLTGNVYAQASQTLLAALDRAAGGHPSVDFVTSNNVACSRQGFTALGGFDTTFPLAAAEDRDLSERWRAAGHPIRHVPDATLGHAHDMGLAGFWRQHAGYGRGAHHLARVRVARGGPGVRPEGPRFYAGLLAEPFRGGHGVRAPVLSGLVALSQVANVGGYLAARRESTAARRESTAARRESTAAGRRGR